MNEQYKLPLKKEEDEKEKKDKQDLAEEESIEKLAEIEKMDSPDTEGEDPELTKEDFNKIYPGSKSEEFTYVKSLRKTRELQKKISQKNLPFEKKE